MRGCESGCSHRHPAVSLYHRTYTRVPSGRQVNHAMYIVYMTRAGEYHNHGRAGQPKYIGNDFLSLHSYRTYIRPQEERSATCLYSNTLKSMFRDRQSSLTHRSLVCEQRTTLSVLDRPRPRPKGGQSMRPGTGWRGPSLSSPSIADVCVCDWRVLCASVLPSSWTQ